MSEPIYGTSNKVSAKLNKRDFEGVENKAAEDWDRIADNLESLVNRIREEMIAIRTSNYANDGDIDDQFGVDIDITNEAAAIAIIATVMETETQINIADRRKELNTEWKENMETMDEALGWEAYN